MKLSFDIPKTRISEIIECMQNESDLETRLDYFSICNDHCNDKVFNVTLESSNEFFIQHMAEAAREKTEDRNCNCLFNLNLKETTPFIIGIDREVRNFSYDKSTGEQGKEPESKQNIGFKITGKKTVILECQECPNYQKWGDKEKGIPDFTCIRLQKKVDPFIIDNDCPLDDNIELPLKEQESGRSE